MDETRVIIKQGSANTVACAYHTTAALCVCVCVTHTHTGILCDYFAPSAYRGDSLCKITNHHRLWLLLGRVGSGIAKHVLYLLLTCFT